MPHRDSIPTIAAELWQGAPESVYYDMWYNDLEFQDALQNTAIGDLDEFDEWGSDVDAIEDADADALEKAAYQTTISNQQKLDLMRQGFTMEEAEMRNPATSGMMTPWGVGLDDEEVGALMTEYPGLGAYAGTDIDEWENLDITADMVVRQGGDDLDTIVSNVGKGATNEGMLDQVWDFLGSVGSSVGQAIGESAELWGGWADELTMALYGEESVGPTIEAISGAAFKAFETQEAFERWGREKQMAVGKAVTDGLGVIVNATKSAMEMEGDARMRDSALYDTAGTLGYETFQNIIDKVPSITTGQEGGLLRELPRGGLTGLVIPGEHIVDPSETGWDYSATQKKRDLAALNFQYRDLNDDLNKYGVATLAAELGNMANYEDGVFIESDVEGWLNSLFAMEVDSEIIDRLREAFANRKLTLEERVAVETQGTPTGIMTTADGAVEAQRADQEARQERADQEAQAQMADWLAGEQPTETSGVDIVEAEQLQLEDLIPTTDGGAGDIGDDVVDGTDDDDDTEGLGEQTMGGAKEEKEQAEADQAERDALEITAKELQGIDWDTQFWREFNQLSGSGSPDAQRYVGPTLKNEIETLWYLLEGYPDDDTNAIRNAVDLVLGDNLAPGNQNPLGTNEMGMNPDNFIGERARKIEGAYGEYVYDFFSDPNEMRYGDAFYGAVEDLQKNMSRYEDMTHSDRISYWSNWNAKGAKEGLYGSRTPVDDVYAYYQFMDPTNTAAAKRLSTVVAMYNTPEGADSWFRDKQRDIYANLYQDWVRADMSPESFLRTFVTGGKTADELEPGLPGNAGGL